MKIAVVIMQYDYGEEKRGHSYEYINVFLPLNKIYGEQNVVLFDFYSEFKKHGKQKMNKKLEEFFSSENPDISVFCLFTDEFDEQSLTKIKEKHSTIAYFFDDPWRRKYAEHWRKFFTFSTTPDFYTYQGYLEKGLKNIIYSPFGFNTDIYKKTDTEKKYDVSFVGGYSPHRKWTFNYLKNKGINVEVFGRGWGKKWVSQTEMVDIFNQSKINLNLSNSKNYDYRFLLRSILSPRDIRQLLLLKKDKEQIKGRHYEINGCGGFQLSYFVPGLNLAYQIDKEIAVYESIDSLPYEINFFLKNDNLRNRLAEAGYERSLKDHTAANYLKKLIEQAVQKVNETKY
jgi:spore maturation protein CgeB